MRFCDGSAELSIRRSDLTSNSANRRRHQLQPLLQEPLKVIDPKPRLVPMGNQVAGEHGFHREARLIPQFRHVLGWGGITDVLIGLSVDQAAVEYAVAQA